MRFLQKNSKELIHWFLNLGNQRPSAANVAEYTCIVRVQYLNTTDISTIYLLLIHQLYSV